MTAPARPRRDAAPVGGVVDLLAAILTGAPRLPGAACRDHPDLFDEARPGEHPEATAERHQQAIEICRSCPALASCAAWRAKLPRGTRPPGVIAGVITGKHGRPPANTTRKEQPK